MPHPKRAETVHVEQLGEELCIYDWQRKEVHALNATAAQVWQQCDGQTSPAQIAARLQAHLDTPHAEELVWLSLHRLEKAHLLERAVVRGSGHTVLSRRQFLKAMGVAAALLPVVRSIVAPAPVAAQSPVPTSTPLPTIPPSVAPPTATPIVVTATPTASATDTPTSTPTSGVSPTPSTTPTPTFLP
jgi:hypothetical protein